MELNPSMIFTKDSINRILEEYINLRLESELDSRRNPVFTLPVVFHIIYPEGGDTISDLRIMQQLERLNQDFGGRHSDTIFVPEAFNNIRGSAPIAFCLARISPDGKQTSGINRMSTPVDLLGLRTTNGRRHIFYRDLGGIDIWDPDHYINIYVCDMGDIGGFASRPSINPLKEEDGILLNFRYVGNNDSEAFGLGRIGTHEMGHYLNLDHPWGSTIDCQSDDGVKDTPRQFGPYFGCRTEAVISCGSRDMVHNFMDFVDDDCMYFFTKGQVSRMVATIILYRSELLESKACTMEPIQDTVPLSIFPNPIVHDHLFIRLDTEELQISVSTIQLYHLNGLLLQQIDLPQSNVNGWYSLDLRSLPAGVYLLSVVTNKRRITKKIVKLE